MSFWNKATKASIFLNTTGCYHSAEQKVVPQEGSMAASNTGYLGTTIQQVQKILSFKKKKAEGCLDGLVS